jgi:hypothetical protein
MDAPNELLDFVQRKRLAMLEEEGPVDIDRVTILRDISSTALSQQRIVIAADDLKTNKEMAKTITAALLSIKTDPFVAGAFISRSDPMLPEFSYVDGETSPVESID